MPAARDDYFSSVTYEQDDETVVVVIGSGAGGGTLANALARRGIDVVVLEAGRRFTEAEFINDEYGAADMFAWTDRRLAVGTSAVARMFPNAPTSLCKGVGGSTLHWAGATQRGEAFEFAARTTYGGVAGTTLADWPLALEDLLPYYERAEERMGVTGRNGVPMPPESNNYKVLALGARRIGYRDVDTCNMAVNTVPRGGRNACDQIGFCMQGCKSGARWSAANVEIPEAEATGRCEVRSGCMCLRLEHSAAGRVSEVVYADSSGTLQRQKARAICVAGNAIETARVLLGSGSNLFPDGLANGSGQVGRNYTHHVIALVCADLGRPVHMYRGMTVAGIVRDETRFDPSRGFAGGLHFNVCALGLPLYAGFLDPGAWGGSYASWIEAYERIAALCIVGEDMPTPQKRITLHPTECDGYGLPVCVLHLDDHENDNAMRAFGYTQSRALYEAAGAERVFESPPLPLTHNLGTCRMSASPRDGVVNAFGQAHEIPNLFVSDGSQFTTALSAAPTLTIVALALRQADYLAAKMSGNEI
jgi:choline dehydrogenase-like flavoprotein